MSFDPADGLDVDVDDGPVPDPDSVCEACGDPVGDSWAWVGHTSLPGERHLLCTACAEFGLRMMRSGAFRSSGQASSSPPMNRAQRRAAAREERRRR